MFNPKRIGHSVCRVTLLGALLFATQAHAQTFQGTASVIDGDTLEIHGTRLRLEGIDAPETSQNCYDSNGEAWRCGQAAALALDEFIARRPVRCVAVNQDRYGRYIANCYLDGTDLSAVLVASGLAVAYRKYSTRYIADEDRARASVEGIWNGAFVMPWEWRRGVRLP